jgi:hypothetical protein
MSSAARSASRPIALLYSQKRGGALSYQTVMLQMVSNMTPSCRVTSHCSSVWDLSTESALHCSGTADACPHVLLAFNVPPVTEPTPPGRWGPESWDMRQRRSPPWLGGEAQSNRTRGSAETHLDREVRSGAAGHGVTPEPTRTWRRGPKPRDKRQRRSPPWLGGEARSYRTRGSSKTHLGRGVRSGTVEHIAVHGYTSCSLS